MVLSTASMAAAALVPPTHPLFDGDAVHEIHLTFSQPDWWDQLVDNFEGLDDPLYLEAEFDWEALHFDSIGVRFKGNSSYTYPGVKKSFKLDIDEFVAGQELYGLDKLNLNNCFMDPSFIREKSCYELCQAIGLPTERTNFAALYINGTYWGLYVLVEQFDQEFIESRFGASEEGNLWKGEPYGTLEYLGTDEASYYDDYELKTNEDVERLVGLGGTDRRAQQHSGRRPGGYAPPPDGCEFRAGDARDRQPDRKFGQLRRPVRQLLLLPPGPGQPFRLRQVGRQRVLGRLQPVQHVANPTKAT